MKLQGAWTIVSMTAILRPAPSQPRSSKTVVRARDATRRLLDLVFMPESSTLAITIEAFH